MLPRLDRVRRVRDGGVEKIVEDVVGRALRRRKHFVQGIDVCLGALGALQKVDLQTRIAARALVKGTALRISGVGENGA